MSTKTDLGALFDEHVADEFVNKDVDATMATMTAEPYVWHVPAMTGGSGSQDVRDFYASQFIGHSPDDSALHPISRTISHERVVEEFVFECTHDMEIPWMLPGVVPTGRTIRVPMIVIMGFEDDRVAYEHIHWGQATVLVQIGLLDASNLPVHGPEQAERLLSLSAEGEPPAQASTPVEPCGAPTGFDSGEPRCRR